MSKAIELAKRSRRISEILMSNGTVNTLRVIKYCIESETELRRLAQVEAEHAALLKAIMDAEPVGFAPIAAVNWMMEVTSTNTVTTLFKNPPSARKTTPLYTLNGIKP